MNQNDEAVLRVLATRACTTREIWQALGWWTASSHRVLALVCERLRDRGAIERHQTARRGVHRWQLAHSVVSVRAA